MHIDSAVIHVDEVERPIWGTIVALAHSTMVKLNRLTVSDSADSKLADSPVRMASGINPWVHAQVKAAQALAGATVRSWTAWEMAIRSNADETHFEFTDPQVPCLQLAALVIDSSMGSARFVNHQNDDEFGLTVSPVSEPLSTVDFDGYRLRTIDCGHSTSSRPD